MKTILGNKTSCGKDCEASNSSSGDDSLSSQPSIISPRKLQNKYLDRSSLKLLPKKSRSILKIKTPPREHLSDSEQDEQSLDGQFASARNLTSYSQSSHKLEQRLAVMPSSPRRTHQREWSTNRRHRINDAQAVSQTSDDVRRVFPFLSTPSGNLKVGPNQVVFESTKVSVLVADPKHTKVNIKADAPEADALPRLAATHKHKGELNEILKTARSCPPAEFLTFTEDIEPAQLRQEYTLQDGGSFSLPSVDWTKTSVCPKPDLASLLLYRITNCINPDVQILIGNEVFSCHLLVLQCYSDYFEQTQQASKVRLSEDCISPNAFMTIYNWMIHAGDDSYRLLSRENVLEVFTASQHLIIKDLEEQCWAFLNCEEIFSEENAFHLFMRAKEMNNSAIMQLMVPRIVRFFLKLVGTTNFVQLDIGDICLILRSNYIAVHNEIEVFMAAVRWLMHDWPKRKEHLVEVMKCVRFSGISPWQLVDIRRNPANPEFLIVTNNHEVQHLIDDGVAYAILKYWYGNQTPDYYHWIDLLGLPEPNQRNWIDEEKVYITYRAFLNDLEAYQQPGAVEGIQLRSSLSTSMDPSSPYFADLLVPQFQQPVESQVEADSNFQKKGKPVNTNSTSEEYELSNFCYTDLQAYNSYVELQKQMSPENEKKKTEQVEIQSSRPVPPPPPPPPTSHSAPVPDSLLPSSQDKQQNQIPAEKLQVESLWVRKPESSQEEKRERRQSPNKNELPTKGLTSTKMKECLNQTAAIDVQRCFVPFEGMYETAPRAKNAELIEVAQNCLKPRKSLRHLNQLSMSVLGPSIRNYLAEGSLFFPDRESVLVFGGIDPHTTYGSGRNFGKDIYRYKPQTNSWESIGELPEPRHHHSVAFLKGRVYIVGGADPREDNVGKNAVVNTVWSYDPVSRSWSHEPALLVARKNFGLVVSSGKLYAIGGQDKYGRATASVERFDPITGLWEEVAPLEVGRMGVAATKYRDFIWVAGGMTSSNKKNPLTNSIECYDTRRNMWLHFGSLRFPRSFSCLFSMNETLFLIGGAGRPSDKDRTTGSVGAVDVWDSRSKQWLLQAELTIPRHGHSVAYLGTQMLIIGGVTTVYMCALSNVECFCCERGTWIRGIANLPTSLSGHGSVTLPPASLM